MCPGGVESAANINVSVPSELLLFSDYFELVSVRIHSHVQRRNLQLPATISRGKLPEFVRITIADGQAEEELKGIVSTERREASIADGHDIQLFGPGIAFIVAGAGAIVDTPTLGSVRQKGCDGKRRFFILDDGGVALGTYFPRVMKKPLDVTRGLTLDNITYHDRIRQQQENCSYVLGQSVRIAQRRVSGDHLPIGAGLQVEQSPGIIRPPALSLAIDQDGVVSYGCEAIEVPA